MTPLEDKFDNILPYMFSSSHSGFTVIQNCEAETKTVVCYSQTSTARVHVRVNDHLYNHCKMLSVDFHCYTSG